MMAGAGPSATAAAFLALALLSQEPRAFDASYRQGLAAFAAGEYREAVRRFEEALRVRPDHTPARFNLARALREDGDAARALDELRAIEERMADRFSFLLAVARTQMDLGRYEEALGALSEAQADRPKAARVEYMMAEALAALGRTEEAQAELTEAAALQPEWVQPHIRSGEIALAIGDAAGAVTHYERARAIAPDAPMVLVSLGDAYAQAGRADEAGATWKRALEISPRMPLVHTRLARWHWSSGRQDESFAEYARALELAPEDAQARMAYALALFSLERTEEAVTQFEEIAARDPANGVALYYLGVATKSREKLEAALPRLDGPQGQMPILAGRAGETYPVRLVAAVDLAELELQSGNAERAVALLEPVAAEAPDFATARYQLGLAYRRLSRREEAARELTAFQRINDAREHDQLAFKALESNDADTAVEELEKALEIYPDDRVAHGELARLYLARGDEAKSAWHLEHVVEFTDSPEGAFTDLLTYYCEEGNRERAQAVFDRAAARGVSIGKLCLGAP